ncbi:MAG: hypothetical protein ABIC68_00365 [Candidatus Omnitrophota bacterium]
MYPERKKNGQSVIEYAVLLSALCLVFLTMLVYMKNSVNARFRVVQDRVNTAVQD